MYKKLSIIGLLFPLISNAAIYQSTDSIGTINFSDTPQQGANVVTLPDENYSSDVKPLAPNKDFTIKQVLPDYKEHYKKLEIIQPKNDATFLNNKGKIDINVVLKPSLRAKDKLVVLLDNKITDGTQHNSNISIMNVNRGTHTVQVEIQDPNGRTLLTSETVTFHMQRPIVREVKIQYDN